MEVIKSRSASPDDAASKEVSAPIRSAPVISLYFSPFTPNPVGIGCEQRVMRNLLALVALGPTDLLLMDPAGKNIPRETRALVRRVMTVPRGVAPLSRWQALLRDSALLRVPSPAQMVAAAEWLSPSDHDLVFATGLTCATTVMTLANLVPSLATRPKVVDLDDVESVYAMRSFLHVEAAGLSLPWRMKRLLNALRYRQAERALVRDWDRILLCSDRDTAWPHLRSPRTLAVPNTVEMPPLDQVAPYDSGRGQRLLFVGSLGHGPNRNGLKRFVAEIWPRLGAGVTLDIVGRDPPSDIMVLGQQPGIRVVGPVPNVVPWYRQAAVAIAPIYSGGGTRIKIIEALALGCPVVSTTIGAEGLDLIDGEQILLADNADRFAAAVRRVLGNPEFAQQLALAGASRVRALYSAEAGRQRVIALVQDALRDHV